MTETITAVQPYEGKSASGYGSEAGFQIVTNAQTITLAIDDDASCCETWGYFLTEDDTSKFVGEELRGISITKTDRTTKPWKRDDWIDGPSDLDDGQVMFVDIETSRGVLQFVAYNAHNGYYGHEARVSSTQLTHEEVL